MVLGAIVLLAAALRFPGLGEALPLGNEYLFIHFSVHPAGWPAFLHDAARGNALHLFLDQAADFLMGRWSGDLAWLRLPAAVWGTAAVAGLWRFCEDAGLEGLAAPSALLLAVSLLHVEWSRRTEMYALVSALSVWQAAAFVRFARGSGRGRSLACLDLLLIYGSPYAAPLAALEGAALALDEGARRLWRRFAAGWAAAALAFLPWLWYSWPDVSGKLAADFVAHHPEARLPLLPFLARLPLVLAQGSELSSTLDRWGSPAAAALAAVYWACYAASAARLRKDSAWALRFCHLALWGGLAATVALDLAFGNYLAARQMLWVLPFYLVAVADGALALGRRLARPRAAAAGLAAAWLAASLVLVCGEMRRQAAFGASFEALLDDVRAGARDGDTLRFQNERLEENVLYHLDRAAFARQPWRALPQPLPVAVGGRSLRALVSPQSGPSGDAWVFQGSVEDLTLQPPLRATAAR